MKKSLSSMAAAFTLALAACGRGGTVATIPPADPCAVALAPQSGDGTAGTEIARLSERARTAPDAVAALEALGWAYVAKARASFDPGYYRLAEQTAACIETRKPGSPEALLLRGHVLDSLHRFREAETLARGLVAGRGSSYDYGLLGDALMEQGKLEEAAQAYQAMIDQKPGPQSYSRAAHLRWLRGDLDGAIDLMGRAARATDPRDAESCAWTHVRLALYELEVDHFELAHRLVDRALALAPDYPPALLTRGRLLLAENRPAEALDPLRRAAAANPLPEYLWTEADALRAAGHETEARAAEAELERRGADDPRTFALFLATRGAEPARAVDLARRELDTRADVFTLDALAWALLATGEKDEADKFMRRALAEGTKDARLSFHAGAVAAAMGRSREAAARLAEASSWKGTLLPSERNDVTKRLNDLRASGVQVARNPAPNQEREGEVR